jgi:hypothetical protein
MTVNDIITAILMTAFTELANDAETSISYPEVSTTDDARDITTRCVSHSMHYRTLKETQ